VTDVLDFERVSTGPMDDLAEFKTHVCLGVLIINPASSVSCLCNSSCAALAGWIYINSPTSPHFGRFILLLFKGFRSSTGQEPFRAPVQTHRFSLEVQHLYLWWRTSRQFWDPRRCWFRPEKSRILLGNAWLPIRSGTLAVCDLDPKSLDFCMEI
jgi:hypothetical protein